jgi:hypothetical protein
MDATMNDIPKLADHNNTAVVTAARLSKLSLDSAERMALQLGFAKSPWARDATSPQDAGRAAAARCPGGSRRCRNEWNTPAACTVASDAQAELSPLAEERLAALQRTVTETVDQAARNAPAGSDVAVAAMKSSLAAATAAFDSFSKAAQHARELHRRREGHHHLKGRRYAKPARNVSSSFIANSQFG